MRQTVSKVRGQALLRLSQAGVSMAPSMGCHMPAFETKSTISGYTKVQDAEAWCCIRHKCRGQDCSKVQVACRSCHPLRQSAQEVQSKLQMQLLLSTEMVA